MSRKKQNNKSMREERYEELIPLNDFGSADALKVEIRRRISDRENENWHFDTLDCRGAFIALRFNKH